MYDQAPSPGGATTYSGQLYQDAAAKVPASQTVDRSGGETFDYWTSEIYSLLKEIPYWTAVAPAEATKTVALPGGAKTLTRLNYDPRGAIKGNLQQIAANWAPSLVNGIVRGFCKRIAADPSMKKVAVTEFETLVKAVFSATDAAVILK